MARNKQTSTKIVQQNKLPEQKVEPSWWQKAVKVFGVEAPILLIVGVVIGIILSYTFMMSKPDLFIQPAIAYAVRETLAVQALTTAQHTSPTPTLTPLATSALTQVTNSPSLPTETPTPTFTPTLQYISVLSGQQLFFDDFSEKNFVWSEGAAGVNSVGYENGTYYLDLNDTNTYFTAFLWSASSDILDLDNFIIQVDALGPLYTDWEQKQGIVFGYKTDYKGKSSYAFDIAYNGTCRLISRNNDENWEVVSVSEIVNFDKNSPHVLTMVVSNAREFSGYVDKQLCLTEKIDYTPGIAGVAGKISKESGRLFFDNFYIIKVP